MTPGIPSESLCTRRSTLPGIPPPDPICQSLSIVIRILKSDRSSKVMVWFFAGEDGFTLDFGGLLLLFLFLLLLFLFLLGIVFLIKNFAKFMFRQRVNFSYHFSLKLHLILFGFVSRKDAKAQKNNFLFIALL